MLKKFRDAGLLWPTVFTALALLVLLGLGTWQWNRKAWKEDVIATIATRSKAAPIDARAWGGLTCGPIEKVGLARSCEYTAVKLTGAFDHARERHVYAGIAKPTGGGIGGQGYWIMTPMRIADTGETIAVSRGFVPETMKDQAQRASGQNEGETTIIGLVREAEPRATFTGANDPAKNIWYLRNPRELFTGAGGAISRPDFHVDLLSPTPAGGLPAPTAGRIDIPNRHLEYAITWWGLAATLLGVFAAFAAGRLKTVPKA
ncbi:MAG: SURF1 family cytochrome oxidase biogenesis protein [Hyphomicrobiaceae bacterium]